MKCSPDFELSQEKPSLLPQLYPALFLLGYYTFFLSLERVFGIDYAPLAAKMLLLLALIVLLMTGKIDAGNLLIATIVILMVLVSATFTQYIYFEWALVIFSLNQILAIFLPLSARPSESQMLAILKIISFAPIFSLLIGAIYQIIGAGSLQGFDYLNNVSRLQGSTIPAFLAGISLSATFASLMYYYSTGHKNYAKLAIVNFIILLLTAARTPILLGCILLAITYFTVDSSKAEKKIMVGAVGLTLFVIFLMTYGQSILARFSSDSSSGRDILWEYFSGLAEGYKEFGIGFGHSIASVPRHISILVGGGGAAHNDYLRMAVEIGITQSVLFFMLLSLAMFRCIQIVNPSGRVINLSFFIVFLLFCYTDNSIATPVYYPLLLVGWYGSILTNGLAPIQQCNE